MTQPNADQAEFWDELTDSWLRAEVHSELIAGPFGGRALVALRPTTGERILDVGCGSGATTRALGAAVGPTGEVVGIDIAPGMLVAARARSGDVPEAKFAVVDAQTADLHGPFDAAYSRFGVMFFEDPTAAFANIGRSLRPGGRLAFACWQDLFQNEWMFVPGAAVIGVTGVFPDMPGPGEPGPFSLAEPDVVRQVLSAAGFADIEVDPVSDVMDLPAGRASSVLEMSKGVGPVREALRTADESTATAILEAVGSALADKITDGHLQLSAAANIVTARWPG